MTYQIDVTKGEMIGTVSKHWKDRPDDQKFLSLADLRDQVSTWADQSAAVKVAPGAIYAQPAGEAGEGLGLLIGDTAVDVTHHSFGQIARMAQAPANYLRSLPPALAAVNLNYGLRTAQQKEQSLYVRTDAASSLLRAVTSTSYGRILDRDVVDSVMKVAGNGTGDTNWKVPGMIDWSSKHGVAYNPNVDITKETTTLYASDRDVFLFLVDDLHPIEVGKLASGAPDLMFRGFYVWNSEVGERSFGVSTMYLRGVCQNRNLWGVEGFSEVSFRHTAGAPERFLEKAAPSLASYSEGSTTKLVEGVKLAKSIKVSVTDEERVDFLAKFGFSAKQAAELLATSMAEEGQPQESVWDHAQAITAHARKSGLQESRLKLEATAGRILDMVK